MKPLISVIIPVYNTERFLPVCIDSIRCQDYPSFELLLIDDGSTDGSGAIIDQYAAQDPRIVALHQHNAGVSRTRNRGMDVARGEYITFVDADDRVTPTYLSDFLLAPSDLTIQGISLIEERSGRSNTCGFDHTTTALSERERGTLFADAEIRSTTKGPCAKLYKHDLIQQYNIQFDPRYSYGEDHLFVLEYVKHCQSISTVDRSNYLYIKRNTNSLTNRLLPYKELSAYAREAYTQRQELKQQFGINNNKEYDRYILEERAHLIYQSIYALYTAEGNYPARERWAFIEEVYRQDYEMVQQATWLPLIFRLMKIALRWKNQRLTDGALLTLSRGKEWIKKQL